MDATLLGFYLLAAFLGGLVSGLAGFALGLVVAGIWLHILTPVETAVLMVFYGLFSQGYGIWRVRRAFDWRKVAPFVIGGAIGVPIGAALLTDVNPTYLRNAIGVLLVLYSSYGLLQPRLKPVQGSTAANVTVGLLNGLLGGLTGLSGIVVTIWCQLHDWPKDRQRAIFQPVLFATMVMAALAMTATGAVTLRIIELLAIGLPVMFAGLWSGVHLYGRLDDRAFRRIVLLLLLVSGIMLLVPVG